MSRWTRNSRSVRQWRKKLIERDGAVCVWCGELTWVGREGRPKGAGKSLRFTIDHVVPRSEGGKDNLSNFVIACYGCNQDRGNRGFWHNTLYAKDPQFDTLWEALIRERTQ